MTDREIKKFLADYNKLKKALMEIASFDFPEHSRKSFWTNQGVEQCAEVIAKDTRIARDALASV